MRFLLRIGVFSTALAVLTSVVNAQFDVEPTTLPMPTDAPVTFHSGLGFVVDQQLEGRAVTLREDGTAVPVPGAIVKLLKDTVEVDSTVADEGGQFAFPQVAEGSYGITVEAQDVFAAHSFRAVATSNARPLEVYATTMRRPQVEAVWQSLWTPDASMDSNGMLGSTALDGAQVQSPVVSMRGGKVVGRLLFENSMAVPSRHFVKVYDLAGALVATTQVTATGEFAIALPAPGLYNFIVGGQGYACISVKVVAENGVAQAKGSEGRFVSKVANQAGSDFLVIPVIGPAPQPQVVEDVPPPIAGPGGFPMYGPAPGGGFAGGGGGFGGGAGGGFGGGGIGGLGGLLGIGGLAAGVVALSDDDDGFNGTPGTPIAP